MNIKYVKGDLFTAPKTDMLVHCISADFELGAGIAKTFRDEYNVRNELMKEYRPNAWHDRGMCLFVNSMDNGGNKCWTVANLVTKPVYYSKPTYRTMNEALVKLAHHVMYFETDSISMPKIGCGLDRLEWAKVLQLIEWIFNDIDVNITVYEKE